MPILYEGRKTDWSINEAELDILFDRWFVDLPDDKREQLKAKGLSLATIAKHPERVRLIAFDIWEHFKQVCRPDGFKAQIVCVDREAVVLYRAALAGVIVGDLVKGGMDVDHASLQAAAIQIGDLYAAAQRDQPSWFFMDGYRKDLRKAVRPILRASGVADAATVCEKIEEFAVHA